MKEALIKYRRLLEIGISREKSREIIKKAYTFEGYLNLYPLILDDYTDRYKGNLTKKEIKSRLEDIFL